MVLLSLVLWCAAAACPSVDLGAESQRIAGGAQGRAGVAAVIVEGGETVSVRGSERFPMQSVYKLPIGMAVMDQVERGVLRLDQAVRVGRAELVPAALHSPLRDRFPKGDVDLSIRELLRYMVVESDGTACDVMLRVLGGAERVTGYLRRIGVRDMVVATSEMEMSRSHDVQYRNWATPEGALTLLRKVRDPLLLQFMTETGTGPHRLKGLLPAGTVVAHKTGTSGTSNGLTAATNDIGLITMPDGRHIAIAVFVSDSKADNEVREAVIARAAKAVWDCWTR